MSESQKILVVYDSKAIRETVSILDLGDGYEVVELDKPSKVADQLQEIAPDLVILCAMSRKTAAYDLCTEIRALTAESFLPILICSLKLTETERDLAREAGAHAIVPVTENADSLRYTINAFLHIRVQFRQAQFKATRLAKASAEAANMMLELEEAHRRISEQNEELERMVEELETRDHRIRAQQREIQSHLDRLQKEMDLAAALQVRLLPDRIHESDAVVLHSRYVPATQLGGDYFDYFELDGSKLHVSISDVTGHGVAPALVSVQIRTAARTAVRRGLSPAEVLNDLNAFMCDLFRGDFLMTMICMLRVPGEESLRYAGAGHCPLIRLPAGGGAPTEVPTTGMPLGITASATYEDHALPFAPGDRVLLYTDGLTETAGPGGEDDQWGPEGLLAHLTHVAPLQAAKGGGALLDGLVDASLAHGRTQTFDDDVTLVLLERGE